MAMGSPWQTSRNDFHRWWAVGLCGLAGLGVLVSQVRPSLGAIAVVCAAVQGVLAIMLIRSSARPISLTSAFALTWLVTYTLRLWQITVAPNPRYHHPAILVASDNTKSSVWILTTCALGAFVVGARLARNYVPRAGGRSLDVDVPRHVLAALLYVFLSISYGLALSGLSSGFLANVSQFYLFVIAYASFRSAEAERSVGPELGVVAMASLLGVLLGFKEFAVLPVISWFVGQLAGRRRIVSVGALAVVLIGSLFYVGIQAQRAAAVLGENASFVPALSRGLTEYDLVTSTYMHKSGPAIVSNVLSVMGSRLAGVDALFVLRSKVPSDVPFQRGRTIWEPLVSIVPGTARFTSPELSTLSLGRYTTRTFWSLNPNTDMSSQTLTVVGDYWLNFGSVGVVFGLVGFGALYQLIDRRTGVSSAATVGLFAYAALPMLAIERNIAYLLVTGAIRYAFGLVMIRQLGRLTDQRRLRRSIVAASRRRYGLAVG